MIVVAYPAIIIAGLFIGAHTQMWIGVALIVLGIIRFHDDT